MKMKETVVSLLSKLARTESLKRAIEGSLSDSEEALKKANFFTRRFKAQDLKEWAENKERCLEGIAECDEKLKILKSEIDALGYRKEELEKIQEAMESLFFCQTLAHHPWLGLLSKAEKEELLAELAAGRKQESELEQLTIQIESLDSVKKQLRVARQELKGRRTA